MAITFDTSASTTAVATTGVTLAAYPVTASPNTLLVVGCLQSVGADISGVTFNGVAMQGGTGSLTFNINTTVQMYLFYMYGASGTHDIVLTSTLASGRIDLIAASYAGVKQSGFPDSVISAAVTATTWNPSTTTIADNSWVGMYAYYNGSGTPTITGGSQKQMLAPTGGSGYGDSNGVVHPAGAYSGLTSTQGSIAIQGGFLLSLAPFVAGANTGAAFLERMT